jgi:hypothetical protein
MKARSHTVAVVFAFRAGRMRRGGSHPANTAGPPGTRPPNQIWVYDFIADPARIPADSSIRADLSAPSTQSTAEELDTGRQLGVLIATELAADIQAMGLSAVQARPGAAP